MRDRRKCGPAIVGDLAAHPHEAETILNGSLRALDNSLDGQFRRIGRRRFRHGATTAGFLRRRKASARCQNSIPIVSSALLREKLVRSR